MKKHWLFTILMALALCVVCFVLFPAEAKAASVDNLTFTLNSDGQSYALTGCSGSASGTLEIPATYNGKPVTSIGDEAFYIRSGLIRITIPNSVTSIGDSAFECCSSLTSVTIGNGVTSIGGSAFSGCYSLTSITIPDSVTSVGSYAFEYCSSLTSVTIGNSVTSIGDYAFHRCDSLTSVTIGNSVTSIGDSAFADCTNLTDVTIPNGVTTIGERAFSFCDSLLSINIPDSVSNIGDLAFSQCSALESIIVSENNSSYSNDAEGVLFNKEKTVLICAPGALCGRYAIPDGVTTITKQAFYFCTRLKSVTIPDSVISIGESAFASCRRLTGVTIGNRVTRIDSHAFYACDKLTEITIPNSVTYIGERAFELCSNLQSITIPDSVTSIGYAAFRFSARYNGILVSENNPSYSNDTYGVLFNKEKTELIYVPDALFGSYTIPGSVTSIGDSAFEDSSLTSVIIPNGVTSIGEGAFYRCNRMTDVYYGSTEAQWEQISIGGNNENLISANLHFESSGPVTDPTAPTEPLEEYWYLTYKIVNNEAIITACDYTVSGEITIPNTLEGYPVTAIDYRAFADKTEVTKVNVPESVTTIGSMAFYNCKNLTDINIPEGITNIRTMAFYQCVNLTEVSIPASVTAIGDSAFADCDSLVNIQVSENNLDYSNDNYGVLFNKDKTVLICAPGGISGRYTVPDSVTSIEDFAFCDINNLTEVYISKSVTNIDEFAFCRLPSLTNISVSENNANYSNDDYGVLFNKNKTVLICAPAVIFGSYTIPNSVTTINEFAFRGCENLTTVRAPESVTNIGQGAFTGCSSLTDVNIPTGITTLGSQFFYNCSSLTSITIPESVTNIASSVFEGCTNLTDVYYCGTRTQWAQISINYFNDDLMTAKIHYESAGATINPTEPTTPPTEPVEDPWYLTYEIVDGGAIITDCDETVSGEIIIPDTLGGYPVTAIGSDAFFFCSGITEVVLPEGITSIGDSAFYFCDNMTKINIPSTVLNIGNTTFSWCGSLEQINIPDGLISIGNGAFSYCDSLTEIYLPDSVIALGSNPFGSCKNLAEIYVAKDNPNFCHGEWSVLFNKDMTELIQAPGGFGGRYTVPTGVTTICNSAFHSCSGLTEVIIPKGVTEIEFQAFNNTGITCITIPATVTKIGVGALGECPDLTDVYYGGTEEQWAQINIGEDNDSLNSATIHFSTIDEIPTEPADPWYLTYEVFNNQAKITDCDESVSGNIQLPGTLGGYPVTAIGSHAFWGCTDITGITIPDSVTSIGGSAFYNCASLESIIIPDGITTISGSMFDWCGSLVSVTIPDSVTSIQAGAFYHCDSLTSLDIPERVAEIGVNAFGWCTSLNEINIPDGVTEIKDNTFYQCEALTEITLPAGITDIGEWAFSYSGLESISIPSGVTKISYNAFSYCQNLVRVDLPSGVTCIDNNAFENCPALRDITIPANVTYIGDGAFFNCYSLTDVTIPTGVTRIEYSAFGGCGFTSIVIPDSITYIGEYALENCENLTKVTFLGDAPTICDNAFFCDFATIIYPADASGWDAIMGNQYAGELTWYCNRPLEITTQPKTAKIKAGNTAKFTVKATGDGLKYQWQSSTDGKTWKNCSSSSATKASFSFTSKTSHSSNYYRCKVTDSAGNTVYTDVARLYVLGITSQPSTLKVKSGATAKFTVAASGAGKTYQWQSSTDGKTWKNCSSSSATSATFQFTSKTSHNGNYYRCRVKDNAGNTVYTDAVRLYVLGVTTQPKTQKVEAGETVKFTVKATGASLKYQWQSSTNGKTWKNCSSTSATKATFSFTGKTSHDGNYYRCRVTDSKGNVVYTDTVRLYVLGITEQPTAKTVTKGKTAKFTVEATGASKVYQWQCSTDGGKTWKNCSSSSATKATFSFTTKTSHSGNYYRCRIKDSGGNTIYTNKVKLTVK